MRLWFVMGVFKVCNGCNGFAIGALKICTGCNSYWERYKFALGTTVHNGCIACLHWTQWDPNANM